MRRSLSLLLSLVTLATVGSVYKLMVNAPIQIVHGSASCPTTDKTTEAQEIEVLGTHRWDKGVIVLYSALCPTEDGKSALQRVLGHQVVKRDGFNWQVSSRDSYSINHSQRSSEKLIEYRVSHSNRKEATSQPSFQIFPAKHRSHMDGYTLIYGRILSSQVVAVEATFDNGQVVRASEDAKTFALLSANSSRICELRIFGAGNQILRREDLAPAPSWLVPKHLIQHQANASQCLPYSHQL